MMQMILNFQPCEMNCQAVSRCIEFGMVHQSSCQCPWPHTVQVFCKLTICKDQKFSSFVHSLKKGKTTQKLNIDCYLDQGLAVLW